MKKVKGIGLLSGGLDGLLAVKVLEEQGIDIVCVRFVTPFFRPKDDSDAIQLPGLTICRIDIGEKHLSMLKNPVYGYGSQLNPCIDCHALMLREAGLLMERTGADFLFTGEVLGQRPMSQRRDSLRSVEKLSGYPGRILRPLSARLLPPTVMEAEGLIDRDRLLDIQGRSRKRQMALAEHYGIKDYAQPGGGCMLTKEGFAKKLRQLLTHMPDLATRHAEMLKWGRYFLLADEKVCFIGRNHGDNEKLRAVASEEDISLLTIGSPGPFGLISGSNITEVDVRKAAMLIAAYSDAPAESDVAVSWQGRGRAGSLVTSKMDKDSFKDTLL
jgi:tRNA-specific 2-thiouridylase